MSLKKAILFIFGIVFVLYLISVLAYFCSNQASAGVLVPLQVGQTIYRYDENDPLKVYVVDFGINHNDPKIKDFLCDSGHFTTISPLVIIKPYDFKHGTEMASYIVEGFKPKKGFCLVDVNINIPGLENNIESYFSGLYYLTQVETGLISMSLAGKTFYKKEKVLMHTLARKGFYMNIAAGNEGLDLDLNCNIFPACFFSGLEDNVNVLTAVREETDKNGPVKYVHDNPMFYSSEATATFTNLTLRKLVETGLMQGE